ncbi:hypothetical protein NP233_g4785 [Leucocoprinus birnbaumii]|uniref:Uncharacterized protein n=1 Tax=Leucocoprinus birnbaumii TaxID=56174 RepID=A0AAD5VU46_9AGAR|nr:hypothetical protein NP233_g4785 [Leucocoprinus birnbaumii]
MRSSTGRDLPRKRLLSAFAFYCSVRYPLFPALQPRSLCCAGQSESGKSTTLKNFQLIHTPKAFRAEKASWRAVVQLNVARSIRLILEAMTEAQTPPSSRSNSPVPPVDLPNLTPEHLRLKMRLLPLQQVEENLLRRLSSAGSSEIEATHLSPVTNLPYAGKSVKGKEVTVNSSSHWKGAFSRLLSNARSSFESGADIDFEDPNDPGVILHACAEDMMRLWNDPTIKALLSARKQRLEDMAGFFLDSLERVTSLRYVPTDEDILRARLKTIGVSEHRFTLKAVTTGAFTTWEVQDLSFVLDAAVGFSASSYQDIFGHQVLEEDTSVNRLEDSILLWKSIVSNQLLKNTETVLFLNKIDIMRAKLHAGIQFGHYVISYGNRPNDFESAATYLKKKFAALHKQHSPSPRVFYCHMTKVTGPKPSEKLLETFVDKLVDSIVGGELHLADFSTEKGAKINLTFGSTNTKPVSMNLEELAPAEAAAHATNVFLEIALQAQSRKCRLHPSAFASISVPSTRTSVGTSKVSGFDTDSRLDAEKTKPTAGESSISNRTTIKARNPELETNDVEMKTTEPGTGTRTLRSEEKEKPKKRQHSPSEKARQPSIKPKAPTRPPAKAGASLANPNKKVRKIQAMEFESDDE